MPGKNTIPFSITEVGRKIDPVVGLIAVRRRSDAAEVLVGDGVGDGFIRAAEMTAAVMST